MLSCGQFVALQGECLECAFLAWFVALFHILALLYGGDGSGVGAGTADAELFEFAHKAGFVVADGTLREALCGRNLFAGEVLADGHGGQDAEAFELGITFVVAILVAVDAQEAVELDDLALGLEGLFLALDGIQDPGNMGTMIRTADAAGFDGLLLSPDCVDIFSPKVLRATMGSIFRMTFAFPGDLPASLRELREKGFSVLSSQLDGDPFYSRDPVSAPFVLIVGNEGNGLKESTVKKCDNTAFIPMCGEVESLNASVAASLMMYEIFRQRR